MHLMLHSGTEIDEMHRVTRAIDCKAIFSNKLKEKLHDHMKSASLG